MADFSLQSESARATAAANMLAHHATDAIESIADEIAEISALVWMASRAENLDEMTGKAKEATGAATDNERLEAEGRNDQDEARLKSAGDKIKDAAVFPVVWVSRKMPAATIMRMTRRLSKSTSKRLFPERVTSIFESGPIGLKASEALTMV